MNEWSEKLSFNLAISHLYYIVTTKLKSINEFWESTKTKKALWLVMLTTFGLKNSPYNGIVQKSLTSDIFFQ